MPVECVQTSLQRLERDPEDMERGIAVRPRQPADNRIVQHFSGGFFLENLLDAGRKLRRRGGRVEAHVDQEAVALARIYSNKSRTLFSNRLACLWAGVSLRA